MLPWCVQVQGFHGVGVDSLEQLREIAFAPASLEDVPFGLMASLVKVCLSLSLLSNDYSAQPGDAFKELLQLPKLKSLKLDGSRALELFAEGLAAPEEEASSTSLEVLEIEWCRVDLNRPGVVRNFLSVLRAIPKLKRLSFDSVPVQV